jgi:ADP-ribosylglycohydrolase
MITNATDHDAALARARLALEGLSLGDAFGERFFITPGLAVAQIMERTLPASPWKWTDDTAMALAVFETLQRCRGIDSDHLATAFAEGYARDPRRGYGGTAHYILRTIAEGLPWATISATVFGGGGSMGNGSAMRVAPVGAYFADDLDAVVEHAARSAAPTHAHEDGRAGAIAVAIAAALAWRIGAGISSMAGAELLREVTQHTPSGATRDGLVKACDLSLDASPTLAASLLGSGSRVICSDTVPFALWCAARHLTDFEEAMWSTVSGLGDRDTTCAIVGGIVALAVSNSGLPQHFVAAREPLVWPIPLRSHRL